MFRDGLQDEGYHTLRVLHIDVGNRYIGEEMVATSFDRTLTREGESAGNILISYGSEQILKENQTYLHISFMVTHYWRHVNSNVRGKQWRMTRMI